jgi:hypothetical protein
MKQSAKEVHTVAEHFERSAPSVRSTYGAILNAARKLGEVREDPKKTSIHLVRTTAFAGVATQRAALILTLKSDRRIRNARVRKAEQTSKSRWHVEVRLASPDEVDDELRGWIEVAYRLS